jgi:adenine deaminase
MKVEGRLIDIHKRDIYHAAIEISDGKIVEMERIKYSPEQYILPGLIDAHVHVESSMLTPPEFAIAAVKHGTVGVVSDPHEIANVAGMKGIYYMISEAEKVPVRFWFGAPSCVPATNFETAGAKIGHRCIEDLMKNDKIKYLAEMMNYPGVINNDMEVLKKIRIAKKYLKPIDGHAPGLTGQRLKKYISSGITTDHECCTIEEAREKISYGMKVQIREGSAARNLESLMDLIRTTPEMVMLCSDDIHPEMLRRQHINKLISLLIGKGYDIFDTIRSATINPAHHYKLNTGLLQVGNSADFIIVENIDEMNVLETWISGQKVFDRGNVLFSYQKGKPINNFKCSFVRQEDLKVSRKSEQMLVIEAFDGDLRTGSLTVETVKSSYIIPDVENDILKIVVKDRYGDSVPAVGYIKGFGMKNGAFGSSISHDSHNIICLGTNDHDIESAINEIIKLKGGLCVADSKNLDSMQLNIAGIMSDQPCDIVAEKYQELSDKIKNMGCKLKSPFMTLSFMALLVIPELKISDKGLFDVKAFKPVSLFV